MKELLEFAVKTCSTESEITSLFLAAVKDMHAEKDDFDLAWGLRLKALMEQHVTALASHRSHAA